MSNRDDSNFFSEEEYDENFDESEEEELDNSDDDQNGNQDFITKNEVLYTMELDHLDNQLYKETNTAILKASINIAKDSIFWRFYSNRAKLRAVLDIYYDLVHHINIDKNDIA